MENFEKELEKINIEIAKLATKYGIDYIYTAFVENSIIGSYRNKDMISVWISEEQLKKLVEEDN